MKVDRLRFVRSGRTSTSNKVNANRLDDHPPSGPGCQIPAVHTEWTGGIWTKYFVTGATGFIGGREGRAGISEGANRCFGSYALSPGHPACATTATPAPADPPYSSTLAE